MVSHAVITLESKDDMKRYGLASPDDGDALALTLAYPVAECSAEDDRRTEELLQRRRRRVV